MIQSEGYYIGLDLGQAADYTAISVLEKLRVPTGETQLELAGITGGLYTIGKANFRNEPVMVNAYHLRHIERPKLGTPYPDIVARVKELMGTNPLEGNATLVVDATGVGAPVVDLLKNARLRPVSITITGGDTVSQDGRSYRVPKRDLVSTLQVLFQGGRLKIAEGLPEARTLVEELLNFKVKINLKTANDSYEAWREGIHDDLVLSVALATWYAERRNGSIVGYYRKPVGW